MSEPHQISDPQQQLLACAERLYGAVWHDQIDDLIQRAYEDGLTLDGCRNHIAYLACELEWRMTPSLDVNPERFFLKALKNTAASWEYDQFDPSLQIND
jgi:hypothetical protein